MKELLTDPDGEGIDYVDDCQNFFTDSSRPPPGLSVMGKLQLAVRATDWVEATSPSCSQTFMIQRSAFVMIPIIIIFFLMESMTVEQTAIEY